MAKRKMSKKKPGVNVSLPSKPAALAGEYLRSFTDSLSSFGDFDGFLGNLKKVVGEDLYLRGDAQLFDSLSDVDALPDFDQLGEDETVLSVIGDAGNSGYLKYSGKADGKAFEAEDMHLMSSIAGFISALTIQAEHYRKKDQAARVLQYLINQLPLGVICFDGDGRLLIENKTAKRLLGEDGLAGVEKHLSTTKKNKEGRTQLHFEVNGRLIYSEGRSLQVDEGTVVDAYVLYDLSSSREKLLLDLDREAYMSESRGGSVIVALLEDRTVAGAVYGKLKKSAEKLQLSPAKIQPVDAYTCACVFRGQSLRNVRYLLKYTLAPFKFDALRLAVVAHDPQNASDAPADELLAAARADLLTSEKALLPELAVLDAYSPVAESLEMVVTDLCRLSAYASIDEVEQRLGSGRFDGLIFDLDGFGASGLQRIQDVAGAVGADFKVFYTSYKQPEMARSEYGLSARDELLQKPFDTSIVLDAISLQFNLA